VDEAKLQLPRLAPNAPTPLPARVRPVRVKREWWLSWLQPAFAVPAFATLLLIGYQNLVVLPGLREAAALLRRLRRPGRQALRRSLGSSP